MIKQKRNKQLFIRRINSKRLKPEQYQSDTILQNLRSQGRWKLSRIYRNRSFKTHVLMNNSPNNDYYFKTPAIWKSNMKKKQI